MYKSALRLRDVFALRLISIVSLYAFCVCVCFVLFCIVSWLTHWGPVTHICVGKLFIIGADNGLSPDRRQAITWTNVGKLLIGPLGTNFSEMLIEIHTFLFKKIYLKMSSGKWLPFCLGFNVLNMFLALYLPINTWTLEPYSLLKHRLNTKYSETCL